MRHRYMYELVCIRYEPNSYLYLLDIDTEQFKLRKQRTLAPEKVVNNIPSPINIQRRHVSVNRSK